ncbi:MAG: hypothetical protein MI861_27275, partial [Pirellulales bacterium]|nr:hypothetical protein [Pirellulales bacterium]
PEGASNERQADGPPQNLISFPTLATPPQPERLPPAQSRWEVSGNAGQEGNSEQERRSNFNLPPVFQRPDPPAMARVERDDRRTGLVMPPSSRTAPQQLPEPRAAAQPIQPAPSQPRTLPPPESTPPAPAATVPATPAPTRVASIAPGLSQPVAPAPQGRSGTVSPISLVSVPSSARVEQTIDFPRGGSTAVPSSATGQLQNIVANLRSNRNLRVFLVSYPGSGEETPQLDQRLALKRALEVRGQIVNANIAATRVTLKVIPLQDAGSTRNQVAVIVYDG